MGKEEDALNACGTIYGISVELTCTGKISSFFYFEEKK